MQVLADKQHQYEFMITQRNNVIAKLTVEKKEFNHTLNVQVEASLFIILNFLKGELLLLVSAILIKLPSK